MSETGELQLSPLDRERVNYFAVKATDAAFNAMHRETGWCGDTDPEYFAPAKSAIASVMAEALASRAPAAGEVDAEAFRDKLCEALGRELVLKGEVERLKHEVDNAERQRDDLYFEVERLREALIEVEAVMSIVPPRNSTKEYLATLHKVRDALSPAAAPSRFGDPNAVTVAAFKEAEAGRPAAAPAEVEPLWALADTAEADEHDELARVLRVHAVRVTDLQGEVERLREALRTARSQIITLGGDPTRSGPKYGDAIQLAVIDQIDDALSPAGAPAQAGGERPCTCHPDDNPPVPCPKKYALSECRKAAATPSSTPGSGADGDGWQMVPKEPTSEMIVAARLIPATPLWDQSTLYLWQAMLAAAPAQAGGEMMRKWSIQAPTPDSGAEGDGWLPIETAPKDGTRILAHTPSSARPVQEVWWARDYEEQDGYWQTPPGPAGRGYTVLPEGVKAWCPLPSPPLAAAPKART